MTTNANMRNNIPARLALLLEQGQHSQSEYRPMLFRLNREEDRVQCSQLLEGKPHVQVYDQLQSQLRELIISRTPHHKYSWADLEQEIRVWLGDTPAAYYGVWVYYPWSERLIHLLDEREFVELRTNRNLYKITAAEYDILARKKLGIIGLSVGQSLALTVALERSFGEIRLADFDRLELSNLNRIRSGLHNLGISKTVVAAREIAEIDPFLHVICFCQGIDEENLDRFLLEGGRLDVLVDECDSLDMKILARYRARTLGIPVVMETSDRGLLDVERFDSERNRPLLHGLIPDLNPSTLKDLSDEDKVPYIFSLLGVQTLSTRAKASMLEVGQSIVTWPQLASSVVLGGAVGADVCRRIVLGHFYESGRYYIDLEELIGGKPWAREPDMSAPDQTRSGFHEESLSHDQMLGLIETCLPLQTPRRIRLERQRIVELVEAAILGPSGGNCQPWQWVCVDGTLFVFHDWQRSASLLDYEHAGSFVALGAACENLLLQAHAMGLEVYIRTFPLERETRLVAAVDFLSRQTVPDPYDGLFKVIASRHTNRKGGVRKPLPHGVLAQMRAAAQSIEGATFSSLETDGELLEIGQILGAAERLRLLHQPTHRQMMSEIRWSQSEAEASRDGLDLASLELSATDQAALQVCRDWSVLNLVGQWKGGRALENLTRRAITAASSVALVTMPDHQPIDYFNGGRAIQRAWLMATQLHVAFQPLTSLIYLFARVVRGNGVGLPDEMIGELGALRARYRKLFAVNDHTGEILLFRLSTAEAPSARSLRRPVSDVLDFYS